MKSCKCNQSACRSDDQFWFWSGLWFYAPVNSYGHVELVSKLNLKLNQAVYKNIVYMNRL